MDATHDQQEKIPVDNPPSHAQPQHPQHPYASQSSSSFPHSPYQPYQQPVSPGPPGYSPGPHAAHASVVSPQSTGSGIGNGSGSVLAPHDSTPQVYKAPPQPQQQQQQQGPYDGGMQQAIYEAPEAVHQQPRGMGGPSVDAKPQQPQPQQPMRVGPTAFGEKGGEWQEPLCSWAPIDSCCLSWCVPCVLLGKTSERIRDPSMQNPDLMNSDCLVYGLIACFTGCGWIYAMMKRGEIRERFDIKGNGCSDCCATFWCTPCALVQADNEVKTRQQKGAAAAQGYQAQPAMQMPQQAYHQPTQ